MLARIRQEQIADMAKSGVPELAAGEKKREEARSRRPVK